jgi:hypothetical protein
MDKGPRFQVFDEVNGKEDLIIRKITGKCLLGIQNLPN